MAEFCVVTGVQPSEYFTLTRTQRNAFIKASNKFRR